MAARNRTAKLPASDASARPLPDVPLDRYRGFVFPNRVREQRHLHGLAKLMALSERIPEIPYIRLSKIERGEVVARADELVRIAGALGIAPETLLVDVDAADFDIARWAEPFHDARGWNEADERDAVLLAAALRVRRNRDRALTIAALDQDYRLPAVILSRLENAQKPLDRWNEATLASLCRLFGASDPRALQRLIADQFRRGDLDGYVGMIANPELRLARSRQRIAELRLELSGAPAAKTKSGRASKAAAPTPAPVTPAPAPVSATRALRIYGAPLPGGLIAKVETADTLEAPPRAGPRAFALRVCRATLGAGLPAAAIVVVDPDRPPAPGGIAAIETDAGYRLVTVTFDRAGAIKGYSVTPDVEVNLDELDPAMVAAVIGATFP
jgi:hypothetical protein